MVSAGNIARDCRLKSKRNKGKLNTQEERVCVKLGKPGHISKICRAANSKDKQEVIDTLMITILSALVESGNCKKSDIWMLDAACTLNISKYRAHFRDFQPCEGPIQVGSNKIIISCRVGPVLLENTLLQFGESSGLPRYVTHAQHHVKLDFSHWWAEEGLPHYPKQCRARPTTRSVGDHSQRHSTVKSVGVKTPDCFYSVVLRVRSSNEAHMITNTHVGLLHQRLGPFSEDVLHISLQHVHGVSRMTWRMWRMAAHASFASQPRHLGSPWHFGRKGPPPRCSSACTAISSGLWRPNRWVKRWNSQPCWIGTQAALLLVSSTGRGRPPILWWRWWERLRTVLIPGFGRWLPWTAPVGNGFGLTVGWVCGFRFWRWPSSQRKVHEVTTAYSNKSNSSPEPPSRTLLDTGRTMFLNVQSNSWNFTCRECGLKP